MSCITKDILETLCFITVGKKVYNSKNCSTYTSEVTNVTFTPGLKCNFATNLPITDCWNPLDCPHRLLTVIRMFHAIHIFVVIFRNFLFFFVLYTKSFYMHCILYCTVTYSVHAS